MARNKGLLDTEPEAVKRARELLGSAQRGARGLLSLDPQENQSTGQIAVEAALGFVPGVGQALALRDLERARRAGDPQAAALAALGLLPGGKMGSAALRRDIFIGPKSKKWDDVAAKTAQELEKRGLSKEKIWEQTGTFRGMDGKWRQEISDKDFALQNEFGYQRQSVLDKLRDVKRPVKDWAPADEVLSHNEFYAAYPELAQQPVMARKLGERSPERVQEFLGQYDPNTKSIFARREKETGALDTLVHEMQHAAQHAEGFPMGSSLESAVKAGAKSRDEAYKMYRANPGEVEARAAALRRLLSQEERRARFPGLDYKL